jgi:hypothetical protein
MANIVAFVVVVYAAAGMLFAAAFVSLGARRLDQNADGAPWTFRLIIAPGAVVLWPLLLSQWLRQERSDP